MKPQLFFWQMRRLTPVTVVAAIVAVPWTLFVEGPLFAHDVRSWPLVFIFAHAIAITYTLGRFSSAQFAWLHGRGYGRATLWSHTMAAAFVAALIVWFLSASLVITQARTLVQDRLAQNPFYPLMHSRDVAEVWPWLWLYIVLLPLMAYGWIRETQPTRGAMGGWLIVIGAIIVGFSLINAMPNYSSFRMVLNTIFGVVALVCLVTGGRLYRTLEVRR